MARPDVVGTKIALARLDADQMPATAHDELADCDLARLLQRFANDNVALSASSPSGVR